VSNLLIIKRGLLVSKETCIHGKRPTNETTGWRRPIGCLKLQVIFRKRATNFRAHLRKMTCEDKASHATLYCTCPFTSISGSCDLYATHCNTLSHNLQHTLTHCNSRQHTATQSISSVYAYRSQLSDVIDKHTTGWRRMPDKASSQVICSVLVLANYI